MEAPHSLFNDTVVGELVSEIIQVMQLFRKYSSFPLPVAFWKCEDSNLTVPGISNLMTLIIFRILKINYADVLSFHQIIFKTLLPRKNNLIWLGTKFIIRMKNFQFCDSK